MTQSRNAARKLLALVAIATALFLFQVSTATAQENVQVGEQAIVHNVHPVGLLVQAGPGLEFFTLNVIHENQEVTVMQGPYWSGGTAWYLVWGDEGRIHGWSAGYYLRPKEAAVEQPQEEADRSGSARGEVQGANSFVARTTAYALVGTTRSGTWTKWGTVAVDPSVIPLGSRVMIEGFDTVFVAEDTGGGIKGQWVDIWFPSYWEAVQYGVQYRRVTVLGP